MKFLILIITLILQTLIQQKGLNKHSLINRYINFLLPSFQRLNLETGWQVTLGLLAPAMIFLLLLAILLHHVIWLYFIYSLVILWLCLDYGNIKTCLAAYFTALTDENIGRAQVEAEQFTMKALSNDKAVITRAITEKILSHSVTHIFSVIFWFMLLGPVGAALYFLIAVIAAKYEKMEMGFSHLQFAEYLKDIFDWIPVRLVTFTFALISDFSSVIKIWLAHLGSDTTQNTFLLLESGLTALNSEPPEMQVGVAENHHAIRLIYRTLWAWVIAIGIITLLSLI